jgi:hypothetical protein
MGPEEVRDLNRNSLVTLHGGFPGPDMGNRFFSGLIKGCPVMYMALTSIPC